VLAGGSIRPGRDRIVKDSITDPDGHGNLLVSLHPSQPPGDLHKICTKWFLSLQISAFACILLPVLIDVNESPKGLILRGL